MNKLNLIEIKKLFFLCLFFLIILELEYNFYFKMESISKELIKTN